MKEIQLSPEAQCQEAALEAAMERLRVERLKSDAQNRALQSLIEREEQLATQLQEVLRVRKSISSQPAERPLSANGKW